MFSKFVNAPLHLQLRKLLLPIGIGTIGIACIQGFRTTEKYRQSPKLEAPIGPHHGLEKWANKIKHLKDEMLVSITKDDNIVSRGINKAKDVLSKPHAAPIVSNILRTSDQVAVNYKRKIKLLLLGDSLVCGVGNDDVSTSPVLPLFIAKELSASIQADIQWQSSGMIGGTAMELRTVVLPALRQKLISILESKESIESREAVEGIRGSEVIVVLICGLNDWKKIFQNFPYGFGPGSFKQELVSLIADIKALSKELGANKCKVYLPNLPLACFQEDPNYLFGVRPLSYLVDTVCCIWDMQKLALAEEDATVRFI